MELVRWRPMRDVFGLGNRLNSVFDNFFYPFSTERGLSAWDWHPAVDIYDEKDHIVIQAELPGVDKKDIGVDVKGRVLVLKGERSYDNKTEKENYYRQERCYGKFERAFNLPSAVDPDEIKADYKDGILKISVPKPKENKPKQITIH